MPFEANISAGFAEGGRTDGVRLEKAFRENYHGTNRCALHQIFTKYAEALTAGGGDPATQTINDAITYLQTEANVLKVIEEW